MHTPWKVYPTISPSICFGSRLNPGDYRLRVKASTAKYLCTVKFFHHFDLSFRITVKQPPFFSLLLAKNVVLQRSLGRTAIFPFEQSHENFNSILHRGSLQYESRHLCPCADSFLPLPCETTQLQFECYPTKIETRL